MVRLNKKRSRLDSIEAYASCYCMTAICSCLCSCECYIPGQERVSNADPTYSSMRDGEELTVSLSEQS